MLAINDNNERRKDKNSYLNKLANQLNLELLKL